MKRLRRQACSADCSRLCNLPANRPRRNSFALAGDYFVGAGWRGNRRNRVFIPDSVVALVTVLYKHILEHSGTARILTGLFRSKSGYGRNGDRETLVRIQTIVVVGL